MAKTSSNEQQVRALDDPFRSAYSLAEDIAGKLGMERRTCLNYLYAKRRGYSSTGDYTNALAKRRGLNSRSEQAAYRRAKVRFGEDYTIEQFRRDRADTKPQNAFDKQELEAYLKVDSVALNHLNEAQSKLERKVRKLDNPKLTAFASAKKIAKRQGFGFQRCLRYVLDYRRGTTDRVYSDFLARKIGFISTSEKNHYYQCRKGHKGQHFNLKQFRIDMTRKLDFDSVGDYIQFLEDQRLFFQQEHGETKKRPQKLFEYSCIKSLSPKQLEDAASSVAAKPELVAAGNAREELLNFLSHELNKKEFVIIEQRYFNNMTLNEVGKIFGLTREGVRHVESLALRKLRWPARLEVIKGILRPGYLGVSG